MRKLASILFVLALPGFGQSINSGTVSGTVSDPSGAVIAGAEVRLNNAVTRFDQTATTDANGAYKFNNVPLNNYRMTATAPGFTAITEDVDVHSSLPTTVNIALKVATETTTVLVQAEGAQVETDPSTHQDVDRDTFLKLPGFDPGGALNQAITYSTGAVAADANGFFHPVGDHAQVGYIVDGFPITDQQSKTFSTQIPLNALQSMELITGSQDAQYGDKTSLVVNATTRSGLGATKPFGSIESGVGSFGTYSESASLGFGTPTYGNFIAVNGVRSGHFLDTPEFLPIHDIGNNGSIFDRFDWQPGPQDVFHFDLFSARNWFQVPNDYDQLAQDQKQRVLSWSVAPGYQHTFNAHTLLTVNPYVRRDQLDYYASRDPFDDTPVTASQNRFLTNYGIKADIAWTHGIQEIKTGFQIQQTRLDERFQFGITDPAYNPVCLAANGSALLLPGVTNPETCSGINPAYTGNPNLLPGILPYDLTRGGTLFNFQGQHNVNEYAVYITDTIKLGKLTISTGLRDDQYNGLASANSVQPRLGLSYLFSRTNTVLRAAYSRSFETPYNENLILSSRHRRRRSGPECFWIGLPTPQARQSERVQYRVPAGHRKMAHYRCGLFLEVHHQRVRLQRVLQHADHFSHRLAQLQTGRRNRPGEHHRPARFSSLSDARPHARPFLSARGGRLDSARWIADQCLPHRSRSGLSTNRSDTLPAPA